MSRFYKKELSEAIADMESLLDMSDEEPCVVGQGAGTYPHWWSRRLYERKWIPTLPFRL